MSLSRVEIATIDAIVSLFESGSPSKYDTIAAVESDKGGLSYGKHQAALVGGSLYKLLDEYCQRPNAACKTKLAPYMGDIQSEDRGKCDHNADLKTILREAAGDPEMKIAQDAFFQTNYMQPAIDEANACGFQTPLGYAVVYDSKVHGSWSTGANIKQRTTDKFGAPPSAANEQAWIQAYLRERRAWLGAASGVLANTIYRPDCFLDLIARDQWSLELPLSLNVNGYTYVVTAWDFSDPSLFPDPDFRVDPSRFGELRAHSPRYPEGRDKHVQGLLLKLGLVTDAVHDVDGKYGPKSAAVVHTFQLSRGLEANGVVDSTTYLHLCEACGHESGQLRDMPPGDRNRTGNVLAGGGAVAGAAGAAAVVAATVADTGNGDATSASTTTATPSDQANVATTTATATSAAAPAPPPAATVTTTVPTPTTGTIATTEAPPPAHVLPKISETYLWMGFGFLLVMIVLITLARRRAY